MSVPTAAFCPQRPAHHAPRECVQNHGQIHKLLGQANVNQIGYPELIDATQLQACGQIHIHLELVLGIGGE